MWGRPPRPPALSEAEGSRSERSYLSVPKKNSGVGNGNRTRNRRSHSPVLCQLSYSHHHVDYTTALRRCQKAAPGDRAFNSKLVRCLIDKAALCRTSDFDVTDDLDFDFSFS